MAAIRGRDTTPEIVVRKALHGAGLRYRLHSRLPGKPDLVFPKYRAAVFVHGCFWHYHDCPRFKWPGGENAAFWRDKLARNKVRDIAVDGQLAAIGLRRFVVWECAVTGRAKMSVAEIVDKISTWLASSSEKGEVAGRWQ